MITTTTIEFGIEGVVSIYRILVRHYMTVAKVSKQSVKSQVLTYHWWLSAGSVCNGERCTGKQDKKNKDNTIQHVRCT